MKRIALLLFVSFFVIGCATDYNLYAKAQAEMAASQAQADKAKWEAMATIAQSGTEASKVAAVMAMALGGGSAAQRSVGSGLRAPESAGDNLLRWASVLVPSLTNIWMVGKTTQLGMRQSDNAANVAMSTNNAFVGMAGKIQAPAANVSTVTNSTSNTTTAGANSNLGEGAYTWSTTDRHDVTTTDRHDSVTDRHDVTNNPPAQIPAGQICYVTSAGELTCL